MGAYFSESELIQDLSDAGFGIKGLYGDIAGNEYSDTEKGCVLLLKR